MKKLKWILLFIMILLAVVFLFATCKKTNAYVPSMNQGESYQIDPYDTDMQAFVASYQPAFIYGTTRDNLVFKFSSSNYDYFFDIVYNGNNTINFNFYQNNGQGIIFNTSCDFNKFCNCFIMAGPSDTNNELCIALVIFKINNNNYNNVYVETATYYYYFNNIAGQEYDDINYLYGDASIFITPIPPTSFTGSPYFVGNYNVFYYGDNTSLAFSEMVASAVSDIGYYSSYDKMYTFGYNQGYQLGYQEAYWDGYADGQTAGYNTGYADGLADNTTAYNHGYDAGLADGYRNGYDAGMTDGDAIGYQRGLAEGMAGATPVSQTVGVVSSIFAGIGSIMAIQLFPGFPLGLLILVPLFFAVLGLILWIWRRN